MSEIDELAKITKKRTGKEISPLGLNVAKLLDRLYYGIYHMESRYRVNWDNTYFIEANVTTDLATYDGNMLTRLVFLAHAYAIRVSINPSGPGRIKLMFWQREPGTTGPMCKRHPTLDQAVEDFKKSNADLFPNEVPA